MKTIEQAVMDAEQQVRKFKRDLVEVREVTDLIVEAKMPTETQAQKDALEDFSLVLRGLAFEAERLAKAIDQFRQL